MNIREQLTGGHDRLVAAEAAIAAIAPDLTWTQHVVELADADGNLAIRPAADVDLIAADRAATVWTVAPDGDRWELDYVDDATDGYGGKLRPWVEITTDPDVDGGTGPVTFHVNRRDPTLIYVRYDRTLHYRGADPYAADTVRVVTDRDTLPDATQYATLAAGDGSYYTDEAVSPELVSVLVRSWCRQVACMPVNSVTYVSDGPPPDWLRKLSDRIDDDRPGIVGCSECLERLIGIEKATGRVERGGRQVAVCERHVRPGETAEPL